jgi:hypothetical protein
MTHSGNVRKFSYNVDLITHAHLPIAFFDTDEAHIDLSCVQHAQHTHANTTDRPVVYDVQLIFHVFKKPRLHTHTGTLTRLSRPLLTHKPPHHTHLDPQASRCHCIISIVWTCGVSVLHKVTHSHSIRDTYTPPSPFTPLLTHKPPASEN